VLLSLDPDIDVDAEVKRRGSMLAVGRSGYPEDNRGRGWPTWPPTAPGT